MTRPEKNGWGEYKRLFLYEMEENSKRFVRIDDALNTIAKDVAGLKVKAAVAGGMAGLVGTAVVSYVLTFFKG